ncbi:DUF4376 domain-containing protein [Aestuariivirga sp.]|uniref:DUF4376 domain-containing protein n=1 Tax=Aestuariivirga sp. TaxID=2650926 RepID=UPI00391D7A83
MPEFALLIDGEFKEIRHLDSRPADIPHKQVNWHPVVREQAEPPYVGPEGGNWMIRTAPPSLADRKAEKLALLSDYRWQKEMGGTTFSGFTLATDAVSQTKYIGAVVGAQLDPGAVVNWKMADGTFVPLDAQAITAVAMAVRAHVQACFDREAELRAQIAATITVEEIEALELNIGWP